MVPCIIRQFYTNGQQHAAVWDNLLLPCSLTAPHVSRDIIAHHQEHLNCSYSFWFIHVCRCRVLSSRQRHMWINRPDHDQQHCYHHAPKVKPEAATAVVELLMMGVRTPETCWAVNKRQVINLRNCCIQLVIYLNLSLSPNLNKCKKLLHYKTSWKFAETFSLGSMPAKGWKHLNP